MGRVEQVAIFWDYENCRPPSCLPGITVADRILSIAQAFGGVTTFKAYLEISADSLSPKGMLLHSELQSSGISITHCPHNGKKDVADKMMLVDMMAYAIDNPPPATILIISGDRDFTYGVSILKLRGYKVVTIVPVASHSSMKTRASEHYSWENIFEWSMPQTPLGTRNVLTASADEHTNILLQSPMCTDVPLASKTLPSSWIKSTSALIPVFHPKTRSVCESGDKDAVVESLPSCTGRSKEEISSGEGPSESTLTQKNSTPLSSANVLENCPRVHCLSHDHPAHTLSVNAEEAMRNDSPGSPSSCFALESSTALLANDRRASMLEPDISQRIEPIISISQTPAPADPVVRDIWVSSQAPIPSSTFRGRQDERYRLSSDIERALDLDGMLAVDPASETLVDDNQYSFLDGSLSSPLQSPFQGLHQQWELPKASFATTQDKPSLSPSVNCFVSVDPESHDGVSAHTLSGAFSLLVDILRPLSNANGNGRLHMSQVGAELMKRDPHVYERAGVTKLKDYLSYAREANVISATIDAQGNGWIELVDNNADSDINPHKVDELTRVPPVVNGPVRQETDAQLDMGVFDVLVSCLRQLHKEGNVRVCWSKVAIDLQRRSSQTYQRAGVKKIKGFLLLARDANIVNLGGLDTLGQQWVELNPALLSPSTNTQSMSTSHSSRGSTMTYKPVFTPLVRTLLSMPKQGKVHRCLRSALGEQLLKQFPGVWEIPGITKLGPYLSRAEEVGIVSLGNGPLPGQEWVELRRA